MSAVYSVDLKIVFPDEQAVIDATEDFVNSNSVSAKFSDVDYSSIESAVQIILPKRGYHLNTLSGNTLDCYCDFNASYSWEHVIMSWFNTLAENYAIKNNSTITISPDNGWETGVVQNGTVHWKNDEGASWGVGADGYDVQLSETQQTSFDDEQQSQTIPMVVEDPELQQAIDYINEFCEDEYGNIAIDESTDLSDVGILYSSAGDDGEHVIEVSVDLNNLTINYFVDGELCDQDKYTTLASMNDILSRLAFDWLYSNCCDCIDWNT